MLFALSAFAPGTWTSAATSYDYAEYLAPADEFGLQNGDPTGETTTTVVGPAATLAYASVDGVYQQQVYTSIMFGGTLLQARAGLVTVRSYTLREGLKPYHFSGYNQSITANGPWNLIKDIAITAMSSEVLTVRNFVDVHIQMPRDKARHIIDIDGAKRGDIVVNGTFDTLNIRYLSNEYGWSNTFNIRELYGNLTLTIAPLDPATAALVRGLTPMTFNTAPQKTVMNLTTGYGFHNIHTYENSSTMHLGAGITQLEMTDGHNEIWTSAGGDYLIGLHSRAAVSGAGLATDIGSNLIHVDQAAATILVDDKNPATMPYTTIQITPGTIGSTQASTSIDYGHYAGPDQTGAYTRGDYSHLTLDLHGFASKSALTVRQDREQAPDGSTYGSINVRAAVGGESYSIDLHGASSISQLHLVWT